MRLAITGIALPLVPAAALGAVARSAAPSPDVHRQAETRCGVERWPIKTLTDPDAGQVNATPRNTTVLALTQRDVPLVTDATPRLAGAETTTFRVRARHKLAA